MPISSFGRTNILDEVFNAGAGTMPSADLYLQLHDGDPGGAGTTNVISHTRVQVAFGAASGNTLSNSGIIDVTGMPVVGPAPAGVMAWSLFDALTVGNCWWTGWFSTVSLTVQVDDEDLTNNDIEAPTHGLLANDRVVFEQVNGLTVPTGLTAGTVYHVISTGLADDIFRVSATQGGAAVDITAEGQAIAWKVTPKVVANAGDTLRINAGDLDVFLD